MKRHLLLLLTLFSLFAAAAPSALGATAESFLLTGRVTDVSGEPVAGAEVFVYDSAQTRRPATFISPRTESTGVYSIEIPAGRYWLVARLRKAATNGPLMGVEKHSGEATELEAAGGGEGIVDFTVAQARDLAKRQRKPSGEFVKVEGRIVDREGHPVARAYAFAVKEGNLTSLPDYLSPLTDEDGKYTLQLPVGSYCLGGATVFPPQDDKACKKQMLDETTIGIANIIQLKYLNSTTDGPATDKETRSDD